ncbi:MAG: hypothetical protein V4719_24520 [Planctomycetota bacterium]
MLLPVWTIVLTGCKTTSNTGPVYKLKAPEEQALAAPVAVSITDKRPTNERQYRAGAVTPADYQQGVETLTLDNFEPQLTDLLKQAIAQRISTLSPVPTWADIEVTKFRVSVDRREILATAYDEQLMAEEIAPVVGLGAGMVDGSVGGIVGGVGSGLMVAAMAANKRKELENHRASWNHAEPGVICEIEMHVQMHWSEDRREVFDLQAQSHSMPLGAGTFGDAMNELKWNIPPTVEQAIVLIADRLQARSTASLRNSPALRERPANRPPAGAAPLPIPPGGTGQGLEGAELLPPALNP